MRLKLVGALVMISFSLNAMANDVKSTVQNELEQVVLQSEMRDRVLIANRLINLGEQAVETLAEALLDSEADISIKWTAASALGEIGSKKGLTALQNCLKEDNAWLKSICSNSLEIINGQKKRAGKVYLYTIGTETTRTDVERGVTVVVPKN